MLRRVVSPAAVLLVFLSCTSDRSVAPTPQADLTIDLGITAAPPVRINEIHYDNAGTDAGEAIEISGPAGTNLTGWSVVLYNGNGGATYNTRSLSGTLANLCDGRGVTVLNYSTDGIQNGSPDGVALVDGGGQVVEFLSYEGIFTAAGGPANGRASTDIGNNEGSATPIGQSLQRRGDDVWNGPLANTFGACNANEGAPPPPPPPPPLRDVRFSELHYDNVGTDAAEAIEIEGPAGTDLTGWSVVLYNGSNGAPYNTRELAGVLPNQCGGRGVQLLAYPQDGIQNGSPDGLALVNVAGALVEFLSYEGTFTAVGGPADGVISSNIGASQSGAPFGESLQRDATGAWSAANGQSRGGCNSAGPLPFGNTITFSGRLPSDVPLPVGFEDQLFATLRDPNGVVIPEAVFTWSSDSPDRARIDADGVMHALGAGMATLRATGEDGTTATYVLPMSVASASETAVYAGNAEFGEPADGNPSDDFIIRHDQYTASFSRARGTPNWVSYDLEATHFGPQDRCDCFTFDPLLPAEFTRYTTADYTGAGAFHGYGIDRGHLARSFDRTSGSLDNATTFYFSNIIPQAADLNQGPWADFESYLGDFARLSNREVYIIAGVAGSKGSVKDEHKIEIPASVWKVALILPRDHGLPEMMHPQHLLEVVAVIMPNDSGVGDIDWRTYKTTVDAVEALSGYDVLAELPDWVERIVELNDRFPTAHAGGSYAGVEGSAVTFDAGLSTDPDGDQLSYAWNFGDGTTGTGVRPAHVYADNGSFTARVIVTDPHGAADTASAVAIVANAPPVITAIATPTAAAAVGSPVAINVAFTDPGSADTHTIIVDWGDGVTAVGTTHTYSAAGLYFVTATVRDDDGASDTRAASTYIVIVDPNAGFATGGGWFVADEGKANFGVEARYAGQSQLSGTVQFHINAKKFRFASDVIEWLVVTPGMARVRGRGVVAGSDDPVEFLFVAREGREGVRLKVWRAGGAVLFDNQPGAGETAGAVTTLSGGNVSLH